MRYLFSLALALPAVLGMCPITHAGSPGGCANGNCGAVTNGGICSGHNVPGAYGCGICGQGGHGGYGCDDPACKGGGCASNGWWLDHGFYNWTNYFPRGGVTPYPGEVGSGCQTRSDYSGINYITPPIETALQVQAKLDRLGVPRVPPPTIFLGKNPAMENKLPLPKEVDKEEKKPEEKKPEEKKPGDSDAN